MTIPANFERSLIDNIQPIRYFALAQALYHAHRLGVFARIEATPGIDEDTLAAGLGLDRDRLLALLRYLSNEGYVVADPGWSLTAKGAGFPVYAPWYELLVGGYASTFQQLGDVLGEGAPWAGRDATRVGAGSCGISAYDALPLVERLLERSGSHVNTIVDLGCGDAGFLIDLLLRQHRLRGIGVEPNLGSTTLGAERARAVGVADRLTLHNGPASDVSLIGLPDAGRGTCFLTAFVLQEILEQSGEQAVVELLKRTLELYPEALWLVIEVDHQPMAPIMNHGLAMAYYNPYYLIHAITEQRLETNEYWLNLFRSNGLECLDVAHPDDRADSTGLEFGYLLRRS